MKRFPTQTGYQPRPPVYRYTQQFLQQEIGQLRRATWGPRLVALLIDFGLIAIPFNLLGYYIWLPHTFFAQNIGGLDSSVSEAGLTVGLPLPIHQLLWIVVFTLYATFATLLRGNTLGKHLLNLKVVSDDGQPLTRRDLLIRYSFTYISNLAILLYMLGSFFLNSGLALILAVLVLVGDFVYCLLDPQSKTLHDRLAHTQVIIADLLKI